MVSPPGIMPYYKGLAMKYKGRQLKGPREKVVPIIRSEEEGGNIIFVVKGVVDIEPFYAICPGPKAPVDMLPGGKTRENIEDPGYKDELNRWWSKRSAWIAITSLRDSPELEWDRVKFDDPNTWTEWQKELQEAGFVDGEIGRVLTAIMDVNGLSEALVEEARQSFLTTRANQASGQSSPTVAPASTPSGTPASELASDPQDSKTASPSTT